MKNIFTKYNSERLPQFQTVTKIVKLEDGRLIAIKSALTIDAHEHIEKMYANFARLAVKYPHMKLVKPTRVCDATLLFPIAPGFSFEKLLQQYIEANDKNQFFSVLDKFIDYVDSFVSQRQTKFEPCAKFKQIFGEWVVEEAQDLIELANFDMIFSNVFIADDDSITQIDYEWIFDFAIPKSLIIARAIIIFYGKFNYPAIEISCYEVFDRLKLNKIFIERYNINNAHWLHYVKGKDDSHGLKAQDDPFTELDSLRQN